MMQGFPAVFVAPLAAFPGTFIRSIMLIPGNIRQSHEQIVGIQIMDMENVDLNLLRIFDALMRTRSVSEAGHLVGLSQPATSFALAKLRRSCDDQLFVRTTTGMQPTPRAVAMAGPVRHVLDVVEREVFQLAHFNPGASTRLFTLSMSDIGEMVFLPKLLRRLREEAPGIDIKSVAMPPQQLESALESGDVDIALGYFPDLVKANFFQQRLFLSSFACAVRGDHPLIRDELTMEHFLSASHAVVRAEGRSQEILEKFLESRGITRRIALNLPHFMSIPFLLMDSDHIFTLPRPGPEAFSKLAHIKVFEPPMKVPSIELKQHWHSRFQHDPANQWLRKIIYECFAEHVPTAPQAPH
jgi:DNA-binding transcriptional LysR family regulator